jgi:hypothetical protein
VISNSVVTVVNNHVKCPIRHNKHLNKPTKSKNMGKSKEEKGKIHEIYL